VGFPFGTICPPRRFLPEAARSGYVVLNKRHSCRTGTTSIAVEPPRDANCPVSGPDGTGISPAGSRYAPGRSGPGLNDRSPAYVVWTPIGGKKNRSNERSY